MIDRLIYLLFYHDSAMVCRLGCPVIHEARAWQAPHASSSSSSLRLATHEYVDLIDISNRSVERTNEVSIDHSIVLSITLSIDRPI
jgi:hypothetical protein